MLFNSIEICAGAGGQALGLEQAGFEHTTLVEIDSHACQTLRVNRPHWNVVEGDLGHYSAEKWKGIELLAGGVPCPPAPAQISIELNNIITTPSSFTDFYKANAPIHMPLQASTP